MTNKLIPRLPAAKLLSFKFGASAKTNLAIPRSTALVTGRLPIRPAAPKITYIKPGR